MKRNAAKRHPPGVPCFPFCKAGEGNEDFEYMRRGFKTGKDLYSYWKEPWAREILGMGREVGNEAEKFRGILRFSELEEGMLFASINPTHNVAPILAEHFKTAFRLNPGQSMT